MRAGTVASLAAPLAIAFAASSPRAAAQTPAATPDVSAAGAATTPALSAAGAANGEMTAEAAAQSYAVRSPTGEVVLSRRRLTGTLGVALYNLLDSRPGDVKAPEMQLSRAAPVRRRLRRRRRDERLDAADELRPGLLAGACST